MDTTELCFAGAAEQARLIRSGEVSARELLDATLDRIAAIDPKLNSYRVVLADEARADADRIDASLQPSDARPLLGVPIAVKDNLDVAGQFTNLGTKAIDQPASADDPLVHKLRESGAILIGKTNCSDLMVWPFTETSEWGATRNPWDTEYSPGGSSGGAGAAIAAGLCGLAVGSDGLGSVRVPAGFCGVFGLKPQRARIWHEQLDWRGMAVNGPLCRSVEDAALFLDVASDITPSTSFRAALASEPEPLRIAVAWKSAAHYPLTARLGAEQRQAVEQIADALRDLGHTVEEREVGFPASTSNSYLFRYLAGVDDCLASIDRPDDVSGRARSMARMGRLLPQRLVSWAVNAETTIAAKVNRIFEDFDVVLTPGALEAPLRIGELDGKGAIRTLYSSGRKIPNFAPWNTIGQPAVSVPAGLSATGLPLSVQFAGRPNDEATLLRLSSQVETHRPWSDQRPPL